MPQLKPTLMRCAICREASEQLVAESAESKDPPDFDTRPGRPARSSIVHWVHACPDCGYCANDLAVAEANVPEFVRGPIYQAFRHNKVFPEKATQFLCYALILEEIGAFADAGWTAVHAAWVCDDVKDEEHARGCRNRAIGLFRHAKQHRQSYMDNLYEEFSLAADLYRRSGEWEEARRAAQEALAEEHLPPVVDALLRRQLALIDRRDAAGHSMAELRETARKS